MKRTTSVWLLLAVLSGCVSTEQPGDMGCCPGQSGMRAPPTIPGMQGPWGQPVPIAEPYASAPVSGAAAARAMMARSMPLDMVQAAGMTPPAMPSGIVQVGATTTAGGPSGIMPASNYFTPAGTGLLTHVRPNETCCPPGGCAPSMMLPAGSIHPPGMPYAPGVGPAGAVAAVGALTGGTPPRFPTRRTSVRFLSPAGMKIAWYVPTGEGKTGFSSTHLEAPGRYNFIQAAIYRLKISDVPNRPGLDLYPTLEVVPSNTKTDPFLAHSSVPISFTDEDFDQVAAGNYVVKVIYLPDPQFQDLATTGIEEVVSSRLEPGMDPISEAHRRGSILLIVRLGNIDLDLQNSPPMDAPCAYQPKVVLPPVTAHGLAAGMPGNGQMGQAGPMMGPNGPMMGPNGPMMMGPNGPNGPFMIMGPNGPVMIGPNGPMPVLSAPVAGNPMAQPGEMLPPSTPLQPAAPNQTTPAPAKSGAPAAQLEKPADLQQVQYTSAKTKVPTPAELAGQGHESAPEPEKKPKRVRHWWSK